MNKCGWCKTEVSVLINGICVECDSRADKIAEELTDNQGGDLEYEDE